MSLASNRKKIKLVIYYGTDNCQRYKIVKKVFMSEEILSWGMCRTVSDKEKAFDLYDSYIQYN